MKELWKEWGEDVEDSGQGHPAILNNSVKWWVQKRWRGTEVYTILLTTSEYHVLLSVVCTFIERF
jgi:hypothetical protein